MIVFAEDQGQAARVRTLFRDAGAETVDAAREKWWIGLRDAEKVHYEEAGQHTENRESLYRSGFEAALRPSTRGKSYEQAKEQLRSAYPDQHEHPPFINGYERGRQFEKRSTATVGQRRIA